MSENRPLVAEYLAFLRRRKWIIVLAVLVTTASAYAFSARQTKMYTAKAQVLLSQQSTLSSSVTGTSGPRGTADATRYDLTQAELAHTPAVAVQALLGSRLLRQPANVPGMTANKLLSESSVSANPSSDIVTFTVTSRNPATATLLVNAYAAAYVAYRKKLDVSGAIQALHHLDKSVAALRAEVDKDHTAGVSTAGLSTQLQKLVGKQTALSTAITLQATNASASVSKLATGAPQTQPDVKRDALLGAILGIVLGVVFALIREALDTRIRTSDEISDKLGVPLLARIPTPPRSLRTKNLLAMLTGDEEHSEPYRTLRVSFDFANLDKHAATVMITSALGSEGKSTTVANLGVALAQTGRRVILVDLDLRRPYLDKFFGLEGRLGVTDVALGRVDMDEALATVAIAKSDPPSANGTVGDLKVLVSGGLPPRPADFLASEALSTLLQDATSRADVVLVDSPPLLAVSDAGTLSARVDGMILVVSAAQVRSDVLNELRRVVDGLPLPKLGYVLSAADSESGSGYGYRGYGRYKSYAPRKSNPSVATSALPTSAPD